jgi:hypothetical protein
MKKNKNKKKLPDPGELVQEQMIFRLYISTCAYSHMACINVHAILEQSICSKIPN